MKMYIEGHKVGHKGRAHCKAQRYFMGGTHTLPPLMGWEGALGGGETYKEGGGD